MTDPGREHRLLYPPPPHNWSVEWHWQLRPPRGLRGRKKGLKERVGTYVFGRGDLLVLDLIRRETKKEGQPADLD